MLGCYTQASIMAFFSHSFFSNIGVLILVISKCSSLNLENAMVLDDLVVVVSKDALVVIDQPEERSSNATKLTLANGETRGNLHVLHSARDNLFAEVHNSLLQQFSDPLIGVFQGV